MSRAGEAAVGQQTDFVSKSFAVKCPCNGEHLAHAGSALWSFIANDDDIAGLDLPFHNRVEGVLFTLEDASRSFEPQNSHPGDFYYGALRREIAFQDPQGARGIDRFGNRMDDVLLISRRHIAKVLFYRLAGNRESVTM